MIFNFVLKMKQAKQNPAILESVMSIRSGHRGQAVPSYVGLMVFVRGSENAQKWDCRHQF